MNILGIELSAIANLAVNMAKADGHIDPKEIDAIAVGFEYFHVPLAQAKPLILMAMAANERDAITIVKAMPIEAKEFVSAWLALMVVADGRIDDRELALLTRYRTLCGLPSIAVGDALKKVKAGM